MKRIHKVDTRSQGTAHGRVAVVLGFLFAAVGSFIALMGFEVVPLTGKANAPLWVIGLVGIAFAMAGSMLLLHGIRGGLNRRRRARLLELGGSFALKADYPWNEREVRDRPYARVAAGATLSVFLVVFLAPFNWWAFVSDHGGIFVRVIVGIFDLILICVVVSTVYRCLQAVRYGASRLSFRQFPFSPGERLHVALARRNLGRFDATLRFVEERIETHGSGNNRSTRLAAYELFSTKKEVIGSPGAPEVEIEFDLPDNDDWVTELSGQPVRYWELLIESEQTGVDFRTTFPLPVYRS